VPPTILHTVPVPGIDGKTELTVGILADTHLPFRLKRLPDEVACLFRGVDLILHAGDVDHMEHLQPLAAFAPLYVVRGNLHFKLTELSHGGLDLPVDVHLWLLGHHVVVNHGGWPNFWALAGDWFWEKLLEPSRKGSNTRIARRLLQWYPEADVIVFGHTHHSYQARQGRTLLFNPGGVAPLGDHGPSVGRLHITSQEVIAEIIPLDLAAYEER
jgi:predicted phosphodiesterase